MIYSACKPLVSGIAISISADPTGQGEFDVASLFASGEQGGWYDPSDITTLFQDAAGTTPVTATGQPVGRVVDKSGRGNHLTQSTAAARPIYTVVGDLSYLLFDGVDDFLVATAATMSAGQQLTAWTAMTRNVNETTAVAELSVTTASNPGTFILRYLGTGSIGWGLRGDSGMALTQTGARTVPETIVTSCLMDIAGADPATELPDARINNAGGLFTPSGVAAGVGNFGTYDFYIGARAGTSLFFDGNVYGMVIVGKTATELEITQTNEYLATKSGVTI